MTQDLNRNSKNAYATKTMKSEHGEFQLDIRRDRGGSFEPEIVKKNKRTMSREIEEKIFALYSHENSYSQVADLIEDIYGVGFSICPKGIKKFNKNDEGRIHTQIRNK